MKPVISALPILKPVQIIDPSTGELLTEETYQQVLSPLLDWVREETTRLYESDTEGILTASLNLTRNPAEHARQNGYTADTSVLSRGIKAKSRINRLVRYKLMSETASYTRNPNPNNQPHSFSRMINLGAVDSQMVKLEREDDQLLLTWKCWTREILLIFSIPSYILNRNIQKWSLPVVSEKGFIFSTQESPTPVKSNITAGIDLGRVEPFTLVVLNEQERVIANYTTRPQVRVANQKRERILKEIKHTRIKARTYESLGLDPSALKTEVSRMRSKSLKLGESLKNEIAADVTRRLVKHNVSLLHLEDLRWATGTRYGSKWTHGRTSSKIEHSTARVGIRSKRVNPRNSSQECHKCDTKLVHSPRNRTVWCPECKIKLDRDYNAAINNAKNKNKGFRSSKASEREMSVGSLEPAIEECFTPPPVTNSS